MKTCTFQWRIQDFPEEGSPTHRWGSQPIILPNFSPKIARKRKKLDPEEGARLPGAPSWIRQYFFFFLKSFFKLHNLRKNYFFLYLFFKKRNGINQPRRPKLLALRREKRCAQLCDDVTESVEGEGRVRT